MERSFSDHFITSQLPFQIHCQLFIAFIVNFISSLLQLTEGESFHTIDSFFERQWIKMDDDVHDREEFWKNILNVPVPLQQQIRERMMVGQLLC